MKIAITFLLLASCTPAIGQTNRDGAPKPEMSRRTEANAKGPCSSNDVPPGTQLRSIVADVFDRESGRRIADLKIEDFHLTADAEVVDIARFGQSSAPMTAVLLFDTSPSSLGSLSEMGRAPTDFMAALKPRDRIAVYSFDGEVVKIAGPSEIVEMSGRSIRVVRRTHGTKLYDAVHEVLSSSMLKSAGRKVVVIFTDGADTLSNSSNRDLSLELAKENDALIYSLQHPRSGTGSRSRPDDYLARLASSTGGRVTMVSSMAEAAKGLARIPDEIRAQYVLCFLGDANRDEKFVLKLAAPPPSLALQYRVY